MGSLIWIKSKEKNSKIWKGQKRCFDSSGQSKAHQYLRLGCPGCKKNYKQIISWLGGPLLPLPPRGIELFLPEPLWEIGLISISNEPNYKSSCNGLIKKSNFICYSLKIRLEMAEIAIWLRKNKATKPNSKPNQPFRPKPLGSSIFCELSLHAKFQFPRLYLSYILMVEEK